ncbi:MAG: proline--tRNA ligase, partial [Candidatus Omnitrophica bacterium]|nr:proline--tRNA ligase [Candidatus Omnitrophota bacterium]
SELLNVPSTKLIKTLLYEAGTDHLAVLVRGDHEVNEAKLARVAGVPRLKLAGAVTIERLSGAPVGFAGPVKLQGVRMLADYAVMEVVNGVTGANQAETHLINVNPGRDFQPSRVADLRIVTERDPCPTCRGRLEFVKAIEVGHVFKLGTKYSQALGAVVQGPTGEVTPMIMGCYGIGINRILAASIEQRHDAAGIIWHPALAPFHVVVSVMAPDNAEHARLGQELHDTLSRGGFEVLLDDREQSPGSKLNDADLVGIPIQVVIGKVWQSHRQVEVCLRRTKEKTQAAGADLIELVHKLLDKASSL